MLLVFFYLYFPTGEGLPSDSVCVYRYLFLSSYRFRVEAVEAALPNTSLVINKYYFEAALPKKLSGIYGLIMRLPCPTQFIVACVLNSIICSQFAYIVESWTP